MLRSRESKAECSDVMSRRVNDSLAVLSSGEGARTGSRALLSSEGKGSSFVERALLSSEGKGRVSDSHALWSSEGKERVSDSLALLSSALLSSKGKKGKERVSDSLALLSSEGKGRADAGMRSRVGWGGKAVWFELVWFWCCVGVGCRFEHGVVKREAWRGKKRLWGVGTLIAM